MAQFRQRAFGGLGNYFFHNQRMAAAFLGQRLRKLSQQRGIQPTLLAQLQRVAPGRSRRQPLKERKSARGGQVFKNRRGRAQGHQGGAAAGQAAQKGGQPRQFGRGQPFEVVEYE